VHCYAATQFVDLDFINNDKSPEEMVSLLNNKGYQIALTDRLEDVVDMYDTVVNKNGGIFGLDIVNSVTIPEQTSKFITALETKCNIDLMQGGLFIGTPGLSISDIVGVLQIICELVNIDTSNNTNTQDIIERTYSVIPTFIINIAKRSRFDSGGYRLLKQCIRNAMDSFAIDVRQAMVSVVNVNSDVGLLMKHKVRASMKNEVYDVTVAFTKGTIIACRCTCKCGSQDTERILCILHVVLPVLYQVTLFIFYGLGEHVLVELATYISSLNGNDLSEENIDDLQLLIPQLVFASSKVSVTNYGDDFGYTLIRSMLNNFAVGTDKRRTFLPNPPSDRHQLRALRTLDRQSSVRKAKDLICRRIFHSAEGSMLVEEEEGNVPIQVNEDLLA
jgi:hypothetical protein